MWRAADGIELFESAWTMDHFYPLTPPMDGTHLESWAMLAALAALTTRLRLGCMVNGMHYRHPAVTANAAVTVDHISGGRFNLGLGAGWFEPGVEGLRHPARLAEGAVRSLRRRRRGDLVAADERARPTFPRRATTSSPTPAASRSRCRRTSRSSSGARGPKRTLPCRRAVGRSLGCHGRARSGAMEGTQRGARVALRRHRARPEADQALGARDVARRRRPERPR